MVIPSGFKRWTHIVAVRDTIVLFRETGPGTNKNAEYKDSKWQFMIAYPSWSKPGWTILSPTWLHPDDTYHSNLLQQAHPITCATYAACVELVLNRRGIAQVAQAAQVTQARQFDNT